MALKKIILFILIVPIASFCRAQSSIEINYADTATLLLNGVSLLKNASIPDITKKLGEPGKIVDYPNNEKSYFYEDAGMVLFVKDYVIKEIGINYNWDGDKKFPEKTFTGHLKIGELSISTGTKKEDIATIQSIEFGCPMDILCASKNRIAKIQCVIAFKDKSLTQIVFLIK